MSWPALLFKALKELGIPTVLSAFLIYIMYTVGMKIVTAHENYLTETATLFKSNASQVEELVKLNKMQTQTMKNISGSNIQIKEIMDKQLLLSEQNKVTQEKALKSLDKIE